MNVKIFSLSILLFLISNQTIPMNVTDEKKEEAVYFTQSSTSHIMMLGRNIYLDHICSSHFYDKDKFYYSSAYGDTTLVCKESTSFLITYEAIIENTTSNHESAQFVAMVNNKEINESRLTVSLEKPKTQTFQSFLISLNHADKLKFRFIPSNWRIKLKSDTPDKKEDYSYSKYYNKNYTNNSPQKWSFKASLIPLLSLKPYNKKVPSLLELAFEAVTAELKQENTSMIDSTIAQMYQQSRELIKRKYIQVKHKLP